MYSDITSTNFRDSVECWGPKWGCRCQALPHRAPEPQVHALPVPGAQPTPVSFGFSGQRKNGSGLPPARCSARCLGNRRLLITCPIHRCFPPHPHPGSGSVPPGPHPTMGNLCCLVSGVTQEAEEEVLGTDGGGANKGPSRHDAFQAYMHTKLCACMHLLRARPGGSGPLCLSPAQEGCAPNKGPCPRWAGAGGRPPPAGHMTPRPWILGLLHGTRQCWPLFNSL